MMVFIIGTLIFGVCIIIYVVFPLSSFLKAFKILKHMYIKKRIRNKLKEHEKMNNNVEHPTHYNQGLYEVIDVINDWKLNFNLGNAIKYIARADYKNNAIEDLEKAIFYLKYEIKYRENLKENTQDKEYCENCGTKLTKENKYMNGLCLECKCGELQND